MTAQEKAKDLIQKYRHYALHYGATTIADHIIETRLSAQCALIAVKELIELSLCTTDICVINFWKDVETEIKIIIEG